MTLAAAPARFDEVVDVLVVGCGYAGAMTAIAAHDAGARVLILEKAPDPGGISVCSAGGLRVADDRAAAFEYLRETNGGCTPDDVLLTLAEGMTRLHARVLALAEGTGASIGRRASPGNYPLAGNRTFGFVYVDELPGFEAHQRWPHVRGSPDGARLFAVMLHNLEQRRIEIRTGLPATRLLAATGGGVAGVRCDGTQGTTHIGARCAVVLACGGFEGDAQLQRQYWEAKPVLSAAYRMNTGDGIRMAQQAGAALWHMWHFHGSYGFRHPDPGYPFAIRTKRVPDWQPGTSPPGDVKLPWVLLDRNARRFMNEYEPYLQDTGARPMSRFRPEHQDYAAIPAWLIADEDGRGLYAFGRPTFNERGTRFEWSADNLAEIELGILRRAGSLAELAAASGLDPARLAETVERWNRGCEAGADPDFERPASSMLAIRKPPFVFAEVWPVVSNTQGGPVHDPRQRILDPFGAPIPRLYAAGELGSAFGHLYMSGGNLAECFVGGEIAGRAAAAEPPLDLE